jgi:hypothetical protein
VRQRICVDQPAQGGAQETYDSRFRIEVVALQWSLRTARLNSVARLPGRLRQAVCVGTMTSRRDDRDETGGQLSSDRAQRPTIPIGLSNPDTYPQASLMAIGNGYSPKIRARNVSAMAMRTQCRRHCVFLTLHCHHFSRFCLLSGFYALTFQRKPHDQLGRFEAMTVKSRNSASIRTIDDVRRGEDAEAHQGCDSFFWEGWC